jgi:spoIIIJ-associated protein
MPAASEPVAQPVLDHCHAFLQQVAREMGLDVTVEASIDDDGAGRLTFSGADASAVIGPGGRVINALQYLTVLTAMRQAGEMVRMVVDADGYRERREAALRAMAMEHAGRVKETGEEAVFEALTSYERRIIHHTLIDHPDVVTYSEGAEPDRHIVISPRD